MSVSAFAAFAGPDITEVTDCVQVWTDGSGCRKEKPAGWAFVATFLHTRMLAYGHFASATVNEAELTGIVQAMEQINVSTHPLVIHTDSQYARRCLVEWGPVWAQRGVWTTATGQPVANRAIIERGLQLIKHHERRRPVYIRHIPGHRGIGWNELADALAGQARKEQITKALHTA